MENLIIKNPLLFPIPQFKKLLDSLDAILPLLCFNFYRLHFYRQLKKDLIQGRIKPLSLNRAARLTALITQIEKGDYRVGTEYPHKVLSQTDNDTLEGKIRREHQKIAGTSSEVAIEKFLEEASQLDLYGVELYHVLDNRRARKLIGVGPESVQILSNSMESLNRYALYPKWSYILYSIFYILYSIFYILYSIFYILYIGIIIIMYMYMYVTYSV